MKQENFTIKNDGFAGSLLRCGTYSPQAVIILCDRKCHSVPAQKLAKRFALFQMDALALKLYGAEGLPESLDRVPVEPIITAAAYLRNKRGYKSVVVYGLGIGSIFAVWAAKESNNIDTVVLVSPTHIVVDGLTKHNKSTGHCILTSDGEEEVFVSVNRSADSWRAYRNVYRSQGAVRSAALKIEKLRTSVLMLAGENDSYWPSAHSVRYMKRVMDEYGFPLPYEMQIFPHSGHDIGIRSGRLQTLWVGWKTCRRISMLLHFKQYRAERIQSEAAVIDWIRKQR